MEETLAKRTRVPTGDATFVWARFKTVVWPRNLEGGSHWLLSAPPSRAPTGPMAKTTEVTPR